MPAVPNILRRPFMRRRFTTEDTEDTEKMGFFLSVFSVSSVVRR